jgi:hypothetical protein
MSSELAVREPRRESLLRRPDAPSLEAWAEEMTAAAQIARGIAGTPFVPASLRIMQVGEIDLAATTANIAATLLTGKEVGLEPMAALRSIVVINGTPAINALAARALVVARGHELWLVESTATRCVYQGRRHGSDRTQQSVWTIDRAKDLGLAGKPNWRQQPIAMLIARATAECARLVAPEVLLGLPYIVEELEDVAGDAAPTEPTGPAPARRTAQRRRQPETPPPPTTPPAPAAAAPQDEPPLDDQPAPAQPPAAAAEDDDPAADDITTAQLRALQAGFKDVGINDRNNRLEITRQIIGRHINTANQLTRAETSMVLDELALRRTQLAQQAETGDSPPAIVDMPLPDADTWHGDDDTPPFGDEPKD